MVRGSALIPGTSCRIPGLQKRSDYVVRLTAVRRVSLRTADGGATVTCEATSYRVGVAPKPDRLTVMLVGLCGSNGSTLAAMALANRMENGTWWTKDGLQTPNWLGSLTQASTVRVGVDADGADVHATWDAVVPLVAASDVVVDGWDVAGGTLRDAVREAKVLDHDLQLRVLPRLDQKPLRGAYYPGFTNANQDARAVNVLPGSDKGDHLASLRSDIRNCKRRGAVVVVWTATTERTVEEAPGVHDTADALLAAIAASHPAVSASTLYGVAAVLEGCPFVNGAPHNAVVPGLLELAARACVPCTGADFKTGQTRLKTALFDSAVAAGLRPRSVVSYNHLGNNDGRNLAGREQFESKRASKASVLDDAIDGNPVLFPPGAPRPAHAVVIEYVPPAGDTKVAMDEYSFDLAMGGRQTWSVVNVCEDSLLAAPVLLDLALFADLASRVAVKREGSETRLALHPTCALLSYWLKAPAVKPGTPVVNALAAQRAQLVDFARACAGLPPDARLVMDRLLQ